MGSTTSAIDWLKSSFKNTSYYCCRISYQHGILPSINQKLFPIAHYQQDAVLKLTPLTQLNQISETAWQSLNQSGSVLLDWHFLNDLELSHCVSGEAGWTPHHLLVDDGEGVLPSYIKTHSWGEFVFDWNWAEAYERYGLAYYPKLVTTIPFTPITSDKLLSHNLTQSDVVEQVIAHCQSHGINSWHLLFCQPMENTHPDLFERHTIQFHWFNRGYGCFDDFLSNFTARQRKNVRKERQSIVEQGIEISHYTGAEINDELLDYFYIAYQSSYVKRDHQPHLNRDFFARLISHLPNNILLMMASRDGKFVASAFYIIDDNQLYGRYWGCSEEVNNLHFELCYYQGIEYCIKHGLTVFNPGAQGEHKIKRGFEPVTTYSYHWLAHGGFRDAIKNYCQQECEQLALYKRECAQLLPFKQPTDHKGKIE